MKRFRQHLLQSIKQVEKQNDKNGERSTWNEKGRIVNKKSVPLQAWSGPEGSRKLRFPDFMTMAQEGGKVVSVTHRPHLPPGNPPGTHFC